ncbi:UPF0481 protein [Cucumis melo var. makuwa]|nr:UPF0481 protein [Cucumis melo var. makuwa]
MSEVEEEQTPLPIYCRNDDKDQFPMENNDVVINVEDNLPIDHRNDHKGHLPIDKDSVAIKVRDNLKNLEWSVPVDESQSSLSMPFKRTSIYKIPKFMKDIEPKEYEPHIVSFGPYHHGNKHLYQMEQEKQKVAALSFANAATFELILSEVLKILEDLYEAYDDLDHEKWRKDDDAQAKFMQMMIIDACFLLVFFSEHERYKSQITLKSEIKRDILLLENQLPFKLLRLLYSILSIKVRVLNL